MARGTEVVLVCWRLENFLAHVTEKFYKRGREETRLPRFTWHGIRIFAEQAGKANSIPFKERGKRGENSSVQELQETMAGLVCGEYC